MKCWMCGQELGAGEPGNVGLCWHCRNKEIYELPESYKYCPHCGMEIYNGKLMQDQDEVKER